jgi:hypothetical protein
MSEATFLKLIRKLDFPAKQIGGIDEADNSEIKKWRKKYWGMKVSRS